MLPFGSRYGGYVKKRKCGADFVYLIEGCGEPEENKRCNTPHLNRYGGYAGGTPCHDLNKK